MPEKDISSRLAPNIGFEYPTAKAELTILLVDVHGRTGPVLWSGKRRFVPRLWLARVQPRRLIARPAAPVQASNLFLTALYLEAEQTRLPYELPYDAATGLRRFSAWLDGEAEPRGETGC